MTTKTTPVGVAPDVTETHLVSTARVTGLLYLAFFITGILGSLVVRGQLFAADDAQATLTNLLDHESLAQVGIALELSIVLTQALTAVWFYRLFNSIDRLAAGSLAAFGLVNAVAILTSAALLATALDAATNASLSIAGDRASTVQLLYVVSGHVWGVAALFFGLWLLPMGWLVLRSRWMPQALGWTLIAGGLGYTLSAFFTYLVPSADLVSQLLTVPSIVGEVWITGYLIIFGIRRHTPAHDPVTVFVTPSQSRPAK
jgi:Domain of unknown function (DUF4386)